MRQSRVQLEPEMGGVGREACFRSLLGRIEARWLRAALTRTESELVEAANPLVRMNVGQRTQVPEWPATVLLGGDASETNPPPEFQMTRPNILTLTRSLGATNGRNGTGSIQQFGTDSSTMVRYLCN